jgi:beta-fructofuranosidase
MTPSDPHRPAYHFSPQKWMNDPIPFYRAGAYHVYFQHNPAGAYWDTMHWGHAVSTDLTHWRELPLALSPTGGGPDAEGCWTGCVVEDGGLFRVLYTGIPRLTGGRAEQVQCLATSSDLVRWEKHGANPVIPAAQQPAGYGETFRDPCAWREGDTWYCIVGGNLPEGEDQYARGAPFLYRSPDLIRWEYLHPLYVGPAARDECPDFFPLPGPQGRVWVLLSSRQQTAWATGVYEGQRFRPQAQGTVDDGLYYAAKTLLDEQGRRVLFGWIREDRPREAYEAAGWSGVLALPRVLRILPDGALGQEPAPELEALRGAHRRAGSFTLDSGRAEVVLNVAGGDRIEVLARFAPGTARQVGLAVQSTDEIRYDREAGTLAGRALALGPDEPLTLRVFVDRSVIEVFANGRVCKTLRSYHQPGDEVDRVRLFAHDGRATVESLQIWEMGRPQPPS